MLCLMCVHGSHDQRHIDRLHGSLQYTPAGDQLYHMLSNVWMTYQNNLLLTIICASLHDISHTTVPYPPASCASTAVYSHSTELLSIHSTWNTVPVNHPIAIANSKNYRMYDGFIIVANH